MDVAVCQQAVNYWLDSVTVQGLWECLLPGGVFVFNTFHNKPSVELKIKRYEHKGRQYIEISWLVPTWEIVQHVQICAGYAPHTTSFAWISPGRFDDILDPWFEVTRSVDGPTAFYRCVKKGSVDDPTTLYRKKG